MIHLQKLMVEALKHRGFAFIDVFQPCVTFNYLNTYDWYKQRVYKLEETSHNITDRWKALEKAFEWGDKIPIGTFYKEERPTFLDEMPHVKEKPLLKRRIEDVEINSIMRKMS